MGRRRRKARIHPAWHRMNAAEPVELKPASRRARFSSSSRFRGRGGAPDGIPGPRHPRLLVGHQRRPAPWRGHGGCQPPQVPPSKGAAGRFAPRRSPVRARCVPRAPCDAGVLRKRQAAGSAGIWSGWPGGDPSRADAPPAGEGVHQGRPVPIQARPDRTAAAELSAPRPAADGRGTGRPRRCRRPGHPARDPAWAHARDRAER